MKILNVFPKISLDISPKSITQDIGSFSTLTLIRNPLGCADTIPITLIFTGSGAIGVDFEVYIQQDGYTHVFVPTLLTNGNYSVKFYLHTDSINLYIRPLNYNTISRKTVTIQVLNDSRTFYSNGATITLNLEPTLLVSFSTVEYVPVFSADTGSPYEPDSVIEPIAEIDIQ